MAPEHTDTRRTVCRTGLKPRASLARVGSLVWLLPLCACTTLAPPPAVFDTVEPPAAWESADGLATTVPPAGKGSAAGAAAVGADSLVAWWRRFDDPQLAALVEQAMTANAGVLGAQAAVRQAQALRMVAAAALWPQLGSSASAKRTSVDGDSTGNSFQAGLDALWAPDVFGAGRAAVDASDAAVRASAASLGDVQVQIAAEVALNYILLRSAQVRLVIANESLSSQMETLQITRWREQAGLVTALDSEQARAAAAQTRAALPVLQTSIGQTRHALALLTGQPPAALTAPLTAPLAAAVPLPQAGDALAMAIPAETLRQRADVRAAEFQVAAALARVDQAEAQRWPTFSIGGSLSLSALTLGALTNGASVLGTLLASVDWPVIDGGAARAQVLAQQAALAQARQVYRAAVLGALRDVEDALVALQGDRLRLASLDEAAEAAKVAALLARQRYSSGLVDFQVVLETQRTEITAQDSQARARADVSGDQVRLFKALGGGWRIDSTVAAAEPITDTSAATPAPRNAPQ